MLYLSLKWKPFTLKNNEKIESIHACDDIKTLLGEGKETRYGLMNSNAETLLETIYNVVEFDNATQIYTIKQDKKWGLYDGEKGWLLPCEFDSLTSVYLHLAYALTESPLVFWSAV